VDQALAGASTELVRRNHSLFWTATRPKSPSSPSGIQIVVVSLQNASPDSASPIVLKREELGSLALGSFWVFVFPRRALH
jgi:hypothetical protein